MLYGFCIGILIIVSLVLIAVILLQAGRGGGLSETFGGSSTQTILGTKTSVFLKRATAISAVLFIVMCLVLAAMTGHRGRSLVSKSGGMVVPVGQGQQGSPVPFADEGPLDF